MDSTIRYGAGSSLSLDSDTGGLVARCDAPRGTPVADVAAAIDCALASPLEFPPLAQAALPGDRVAVILGEAIPRAKTLVARTIETLLANGVEPGDISLVCSAVTAAAGDPLEELSAAVRRAIHFTIHDPVIRETLSYLAASTDAKPIYINRAIHDADFLISIGALQLDDALGYYGIHSSVFPTFSDVASLERFRSPKAGQRAERERLRRQADEVCWLLGLQFTVQVVPGANDDVLHVLAGESEAVRLAGSRLCHEAWSYQLPRKASLVVATIEGDESQQTWQNVARALYAASFAVDEAGDVALCTSLDERLGLALQQIVGAENRDEVLESLDELRPDDALPAAQLLHALERGKVYLISRLDENLVEELGMLPVEADQLARLVSRYDSCIVLANAHRALAIAGSPATDATTARPRSRK